MKTNQLHWLPEFPAFKTITLSDRTAYDAFYKQFKPYSDFSFNNLWVWFNQDGGLAMARHNGNVVVRFNDPFDGGALVYSVFGNEKCGVTIDRLLRWQHAMGIERRIAMVPEVTIENINKHVLGFTYVEDLDNRDYIYDIAAMHAAAGRRYMKYRHALSYFKNHYSATTEVLPINIHDMKERVRLINQLHMWESTYRQTNQAMVEGAALDRLFVCADQLPVNCQGLYVDGKLQSFALYQLTSNDEYVIVNHLKCNNAYNYIFDVTISQLVAMFHATGRRYMNLEQDLGIPGLRTHKERLRPVGYLNRYTITLP